MPDLIKAETLGLEFLGGDGYLLKLSVPREDQALPLPGQFAMLRPTNASIQVFLGRPLSYFDAIPMGNGYVEEHFYLKVVGQGTRALADLNIGAPVEYLGPFGGGFSVPDGRAWLVGGGVGIAPMHHLVAESARRGVDRSRYRLFYGGRRKVDLPFLKDLEPRVDRLFITTDDGSMGTEGRVTDALVPEMSKLNEKERQDVQIYTCGPTPMMAAVARLSAKEGLKCLASLETRMACGYGVCLGCTVHLEGEGYVRTCVEGPVLDASRLNFDERWL